MEGLFVEKKGRAGARGAVAVSSAARLILSKLNETKILSKQTSNLRPEWNESQPFAVRALDLKMNFLSKKVY